MPCPLGEMPISEIVQRPVYLFLRGIDGPERGAYVMQPAWPLLDALDTLLADEEHAA